MPNLEANNTEYFCSYKVCTMRHPTNNIVRSIILSQTLAKLVKVYTLAKYSFTSAYFILNVPFCDGKICFPNNSTIPYQCLSY